jgi:1-acyl-sn-glycerol-3-phosphate acyltransferase
VGAEGPRPLTGAVEPAPPLARRPGRVSDAAFRVFRGACALLLWPWFRLRVEGRPPAAGAYVLAANHTSFLDPIVLGAVVARRVVFLMTEVVWRSPRLGWFYRWNRAVPVRPRGGNRDAMRAARAVLQDGRVVAVFPEGGLSRDGLPLLGSPGAVSLVLEEGVPIVPVGIVGADRALPPGAAWPRPRRIVIRFGAPITPAELDALPGDRRGRLQAATQLIMARIAMLTGNTPRADELAASRKSARNRGPRSI